jgi:predicted N-acetyltransferase YhbS
MTTTDDALDGPRAVRPDEMESLRALTGRVFRPTLADEYPHLFQDDNRDNLRVCVDPTTGRCVSHVGMTVRDATLLGCRVRVGCIGAVCTDPDYRGRGLAGRCLDDAAAKARANGVDFLLVSGDRGLYRRRGCVPVGADTVFTADADVLSTTRRDFEVTVSVFNGDADFAQAAACYRREPVRFLRPPGDWENARRCGVVMDRPSDFLAVREPGDGTAFLGHVVLQRPGDDGTATLAEFAGERRALLAVLPALLTHFPGTRALRWQVQRHDTPFHALCARAGFRAETVPTPGTVTLLNFPQLMERLRPRFVELLGARDAARLSFREDETGRCLFRFGGDEIALSRDAAARRLFGTPDDNPAAPRSFSDSPTDLGATLDATLPLPTLYYGLNYV